jgi:hypothetical protein
VTLSQNTPDAAFGFRGFTLRAPQALLVTEGTEPESTEIEPAQRPSPTPTSTATAVPTTTPTPARRSYPYPSPITDADDDLDDELEDD